MEHDLRWLNHLWFDLLWFLLNCQFWWVVNIGTSRLFKVSFATTHSRSLNSQKGYLNTSKRGAWRTLTPFNHHLWWWVKKKHQHVLGIYPPVNSQDNMEIYGKPAIGSMLEFERKLPILGVHSNPPISARKSFNVGFTIPRSRGFNRWPKSFEDATQHKPYAVGWWNPRKFHVPGWNLSA